MTAVVLEDWGLTVLPPRPLACTCKVNWRSVWAAGGRSSEAGGVEWSGGTLPGYLVSCRGTSPESQPHELLPCHTGLQGKGSQG